MKTKRWLVLLLVVIMLVSLSACNSGNTDADTDADVDVAVNEESSQGTNVYDYEDEGQIFFDYPASYSYSDDTGMLTFKNTDKSLTIMVKATFNTNDLENTIEYYEGYNTFEEFTQEDITIAGYDALRISYLDEWGDYQMSTLIMLGDDANYFNGISFYASSSKGKDLLSDPELNAMLESVRVTE